MLTGRRGAAAGGVVLLVRFGIGAVLNYGFGVALAWMLTPAQFGAVSVLQNVQFFSFALLSAGFPWALTAVVARGADREMVAATYRAAFAGNLIAGTVLVAVFVVVQSSQALIPAASPIEVAAVALMIMALSVNSTAFGALQGERRFDAFGLMQIAEVAVKVTVAMLLIGLLHRGVDGVAVGFLAGALVATAIGWRALRDRLPGRGPVAWRPTGRRAVSMGTASAAFGVILTVDVIALSALGVDAVHVAVYQAALTLARAPFFVGDALSNAVFPFIAEAKSDDEVNGWFGATFQWVPLVLVPLQLILFLVPSLPLKFFFPEAYGEAAPLLRVLTAGTLGLLTTDMLIKALNAREMSAAVARRVPIALAAEVAALLIAVPRWGAVGAAVAFAAGCWVGAVLLARLYLRRYRPARIRPGIAARYLLALSPLIACLVAAGTLPDAPAVVTIAAGLTGYGVAALRLGLVRDKDVERIRRLLPRRRAAVRS